MATTAQTFRVTGIDLNGYMATDTQRAIEFYRNVLGIEPTTVYPDDAGAEYEFADGATFGLWNPNGMMPFRPGVGVMFAVDDFDAAVAHAKERGAPVHMQHESPVCFMAMTEDTEGNSLIIHKRKTAD